MTPFQLRCLRALMPRNKKLPRRLGNLDIAALVGCPGVAVSSALRRLSYPTMLDNLVDREQRTNTWGPYTERWSLNAAGKALVEREFRLTTAQADGLRRVRDRGPDHWFAGVRSRSGGAISRMFEALVERGLATKAPHEITEKGRVVLAEWEKRK